MGIFISAIIIVALIFYASKELLIEKDLPSWTNIALTALILFTVILSIYMILRKPYDAEKAQAKTAPQQQTSVQQPPVTPVEEMTDDDIMLAIAEEYLLAQDQYKLINPNATDSDKVATDFIVKKYDLTPEEWQTFLQDAAKNDLFTKARRKIGGQSSDVNYLIPTSK